MRLLFEGELTEDQIIYPSPSNPRLKGLTPDEPSIISLAESIRKDGQLQKIIVQKVGDKYETVDGDRRCVAVFKVLKWKTIKAVAYEMTPREAMRLRLVSNIQKEELSPVEKGSYCFELFKILAEEEKLNPTDAWNNRYVRSKILAEISNEVGVSPATVINWIRLWRTYPPEAQKMIASSKEELRAGLVPPSTAMLIGSLARAVGADPHKLLKMAVENMYTASELEYVKRQLKEGREITPEEIPQIIEEYRKGFVSRSVSISKSIYNPFKKLSDEMGIRFDELLQLAIRFALSNAKEFREFIIQRIKRR
jgi:hypothetical protein